MIYEKYFLMIFKFRCKDIAFLVDTKFYFEDFTKKLRKKAIILFGLKSVLLF
jgi:phenylalanyl-tRNA synthetase beta subunit